MRILAQRPALACSNGEIAGAGDEPLPAVPQRAPTPSQLDFCDFRSLVLGRAAAHTSIGTSRSLYLYTLRLQAISTALETVPSFIMKSARYGMQNMTFPARERQ